MNHKQFTFWNRIAAWGVFLVALVTYTLTLEPTASFWDCGEFIASSYKLEVGHPPGNPVFQLVARFFSMFTGAENAAVAINWMSGLCSAFTIFFLYLTIVFFAKRLFQKEADGTWSTGNAIAIIGSGVVGGLAYTFSDTFWFSAVEAEVYAMSSLFTALVFWIMTKWYEDADKPHADRWIVLVFFLMGLSIGVHLLNLLALPALVFLYAYRKRETFSFKFWQLAAILGASLVLLGFLVFLFIPYLPKVAAVFDLAFVNSLGLPCNTGAAFFMVLLLTACFILLFSSRKSGSYYLHLVTLCFTTLVIGFSLFSVVIIRSSVKTPTNEYQPDNPYTLERYLSREQYGSAPLVYGPYYGARLDSEEPYRMGAYHALVDGKYVESPQPPEGNYLSEDKMLFPRMWSSSSEQHRNYYVEHYQPETALAAQSGRYVKPSFLTNLGFFFDYQLDWMYWRYFFWNFAGRQNDIHGQEPNAVFGNWESGIGPLDRARLGDGELLPDALKDNPGKNHYYMLPLLLGIFGLMVQFVRDKRGVWLVFLMFFMTGIAIVVYLNQPPMQVRERDYAYAGSFYFYAAWIGLGVAAVYCWLQDILQGKGTVITASCVSALCLGVPALMAAENWDDHDRSHRYTAAELGRNYLNSVGPDGYLITHGDNDTFPLWYSQEVDGVRPDVRVINTSLLGTDWHIDQMRYAVNESAPIALSIPYELYLYGKNEQLMVGANYDLYRKTGPDRYEKVVFPKTDTLSAAIASFLSTQLPEREEFYFRSEYFDDHGKRKYSYERMDDYYYLFPTGNLILPITLQHKHNMVECGILPPELVDECLGNNDGELTEDEIEAIPSSIPLKFSYLYKPQLFMLDLLANYQWDRPLNSLPDVGHFVDVGQGDYLMYVGFSSVLTPLKKEVYSGSKAYADLLYSKIFPDAEDSVAADHRFVWDALGRTDYYADYQNQYTFLASSSQRLFFYYVAKAQLEAASKESLTDEERQELDQRIVKTISHCIEVVPASQFPYDSHWLGFSTNDSVVSSLISMLYQVAGNDEAVAERATAMADALAEDFGYLLLDNASGTQGADVLFEYQYTYGQEILYLLYSQMVNRDLPHQGLASRDLEDALRSGLVSLLCNYEVRTSLDIKDMQDLYHQLLVTEVDGEGLVPDEDLMRVASCHARLLGSIHTPSEPMFLAVAEYAIELDGVFNSAELRKLIPGLALECRAASSEELRNFLEYIGYFTDEGWIDDATAVRAVNNQKGLLQTVASGDTIDDLYEMAVVAHVLQDLWTREDIARYANSVQSKIRAVYKTIMNNPNARKQDDELEEFIQFTGFLADMGFVSEDQIVALLSR